MLSQNSDSEADQQCCLRQQEGGLLEPAASKIKSLTFATEAAITILRIDDMIKLAPEKREEGSYGDAVAREELYVIRHVDRHHS